MIGQRVKVMGCLTHRKCENCSEVRRCIITECNIGSVDKIDDTHVTVILCSGRKVMIDRNYVILMGNARIEKMRQT